MKFFSAGVIFGICRAFKNWLAVSAARHTLWRMKKFIAAALLGATLAGCNTPDKEIYSRQIDIDSIPQGAPIVVDGLKLGKTPISIGVETNDAGYFVRKTVITAIPQEASLHTQVTTFPGYIATNPDPSRVPQKVIFNMQKPASEGDSVTIEY